MPGADEAGQRTAEGKVDRKADLLGSRMMQMGRGEEWGGEVYPPFSRAHLPALSCAPAAVERGCREETAVQLQGQGPAGELAPEGSLGYRRGGG